MDPPVFNSIDFLVSSLFAPSLPFSPDTIPRTKEPFSHQGWSCISPEYLSLCVGLSILFSLHCNGSPFIAGLARLWQVLGSRRGLVTVGEDDRAESESFNLHRVLLSTYRDFLSKASGGEFLVRFLLRPAKSRSLFRLQFPARRPSLGTSQLPKDQAETFRKLINFVHLGDFIDSMSSTAGNSEGCLDRLLPLLGRSLDHEGIAKLSTIHTRAPPVKPPKRILIF